MKLIDCCDPKTITADVDSHTFSDNDNKCEYTIEAHPTKSIKINLEYNYRMIIWFQFEVDGVQNEIFAASLRNTEYWRTYHYESPKNVSLRIEVDHIGNSYIEFNIQRIETEREVCKFPYIVVGVNDTLIQEHEAKLGKEVHCAYRLVPDTSDDSFNEILLNFDTNMDYKIQKHNNGSIGEFESKSQSEVFPIGVVDLSFSRSGSIPRISSKLVHISCSCGDTTFSNFSENNMMNVRSPGFPRANCVHKECEYNINYSSNTSEILLFDIQSELGKEDQLTMNETGNYKKVINYPTYMPTSFAFKPRDFVINYRASGENIDRFFEINVTRIAISEECRCSSYLDKSYTEPGSFSFFIPKTCKNVFCYWRIELKETHYMSRLAVKMSMENPNTNDIISCNNEKFILSKSMHETIYSTKNLPMDIEFRRYNLTNEKDTQLNISWRFSQDCVCSAEELILDGKSAKAFTTPNYPDNYCSNTKCRHHIIAPNDTFIELTIVNLELENFHDFLRIYDEKNNLIAELTGNYENNVIVSPGNVMNLLFESDSNQNFKGYFIHAISKEQPTEVPVISEAEPTGSNTMLILILTILAVLVIATLIGMVKFGIARKLSNRVVYFSNYPTGSNVSINISSM